MAGRKQHYIPQSLLRGFEASRGGKKSQVVIYKRGAQPYTSSTEGVAAQRDFYSPPGDGEVDTLDDLITTFEQKCFNPFLDSVRAASDGESIDAEIAAVAVVHLTFRAAHLRGSFAQFAQKLIVRFGDMLDDQNQLCEFMEVDSSEQDSRLSTEIKKTLDELGAAGLAATDRSRIEKIVRFRFREKFDLIMPSFAPSIRELLLNVRSTMPKMLERGHVQALQQSLAPKNRVAALKRLQWRMISTPPHTHFFLPDCVAIAADRSGEMHPYAMRSDEEVTLVAMPVSSEKVLVGFVTQESLDISDLNTHFARCSLEFFVSSAKAPAADALAAHIGEALNTITDGLIEDDLTLSSLSKHPEPLSKKLPLQKVRVDFTSATNKSARLIKAIQRIVTEQYSNRETDRIDSILIADDVPCEVARIYGRPLSAYETAMVTLGTVETLATSVVPSVKIVIPTKVAQLLIARDTNLSRSAINLVRFLLGRASYVDFWLTKVVSQLQERMFTARERLALDLTQKFLSQYHGALTTAPALHMTDIRDGELVSAHSISIAIATLESARGQCLNHKNMDVLLADVVPALDILLGTVSAYCGLQFGKSIELSPASVSGQRIAEAGLWDWLILFDRDLRHHFNLISQKSPPLTALLSLTEHIERVLWQFGIFLSDTDTGQLWVDISNDAQLRVWRQILNS